MKGRTRKSLILLLALAVVILAVAALLIAQGVIVFDRSGQRRGEGVYWKDTMYVPSYGEYSEGRTIAKTEDGWQINEVEEDSSHTFIVLRSFLDQSLLVRDDYEIPNSGEITCVFWDGKKIEDEMFCDTIADILSRASGDFSFVTEAIYQSNDTQSMKVLYVGYEGCPIGTEYIGYLGTVEGSWCITTTISPDQHNSDGSPKPYTVWCYTIPVEYEDILDNYMKK
ncbi:MAG: hypothetical protein IJA20_02430 [Methanocorpusculum sp.]|nr:hypothetical protein [Oscillospiraceae bacterium]MBQ3569510.1 hypothetical protein [Methanocorpusculum sp.]